MVGRSERQLVLLNSHVAYVLDFLLSSFSTALLIIHFLGDFTIGFGWLCDGVLLMEFLYHRHYGWMTGLCGQYVVNMIIFFCSFEFRIPNQA